MMKSSIVLFFLILGLAACNSDADFQAESPSQEEGAAVVSESESSLGADAEKGELKPVPKKQETAIEQTGDRVGDRIGIGKPVVDRIQVNVNILEEFNGAADIIFLVDTSSSMKEEQERLEENMNNFLKAFDESYGNLDFQIVMIGKNFQFPNLTKSEFEIVEHELIGYDSLEYLMGFLKSPQLSKVQLRPGVRKEVVVLSDTNAKTRSSVFLDFMSANKSLGPIGINGMVGLSTSKQNDWCQIAGPGSAIIDLSKSSLTKGYVDDICSSDWKSLLESFAKTLIEKNTMIELVLSSPVVEGGKVDVYVNGQVLPSDHYRINYQNQIIILSGQAGFKEGDQVEVAYEAAK